MSHVVDKKCHSGVCTDLLEYFIVEENCIGCTACARACPVGCIRANERNPTLLILIPVSSVGLVWRNVNLMQ